MHTETFIFNRHNDYPLTYICAYTLLPSVNIYRYKKPFSLGTRHNKMGGDVVWS